MKSSTMNLMLAAAILLVASTVASAQGMSAEIPFNFVAAGKVMPAGTYHVSDTAGQSHFRISDAHGHQALLAAHVDQDPVKEWTRGNGGVLQFTCSDACTLQQIWTNTGFPAHKLQVTDHRTDQPTRVAVIRLVAHQ